jgi:hypothetical protein
VHGEVAAVRGHGEVGAAIDRQCPKIGRLRVRPQPLLLKIIASLGGGALLVERALVARRLLALGIAKGFAVTVLIVPQELARLAAKRILCFGNSWK